MATNIINSLQSGDNIHVFSMPYGTCSTKASTPEKVVSSKNNFTLEAGARITIKFTEANNVVNPTLNIKSLGAKPIYWNGSALPSSQYWPAGATLEFVYNGAQFDLIGVAKDNNTTYSAGAGIDLSNGQFSNGGVRSVGTGTTNGTISVNTGGTVANVAVKGLGSAAYTNSSAYDPAGTAAAVKNDLLNGAGAAYDTLKELGDLIDDNEDAITALNSLISGRKVSAGSGLTGGGALASNITISHADTSSQSSVSASGRKYITGVTLDTYGHVTGLKTGTETVTNTD